MPTRISAEIEAAAAGSVVAPNWSYLTSVVGTRLGQPGEVPVSDTGTHTDPVVGGTVPNAGRFSWHTSPAGWRYAGTIVDPTSVTSAINRSSIGVLTASVVPAASNAWTVAWTQARGVWNGGVINIADQPAVTIAAGETMYVDLVGGGPSTYTVTKAVTSLALRADFAVGRKLQLLFNQAGFSWRRDGCRPSCGRYPVRSR